MSGSRSTFMPVSPSGVAESPGVSVELTRRLRETAQVDSKVKYSALDGRTTRHADYATSQRKRKLIEEAFGWAKTIAGVAKVKVRGLARVRHCFTLAMTAYNLIRMPKLLGWTAA